MESTVKEPTTMGKRFFAGRIATVGALLLLFVLLAPPVVSPGPGDAPGNPFNTQRISGDNSAVPPEFPRFRAPFRSPGTHIVGRVANGIFRGAQPEPEGYATLKEMGVRTVINLRTRHGERKAVERRGCGMSRSP